MVQPAGGFGPPSKSYGKVVTPATGVQAKGLVAELQARQPVAFIVPSEWHMMPMRHVLLEGSVQVVVDFFGSQIVGSQSPPTIGS